MMIILLLLAEGMARVAYYVAYGEAYARGRDASVLDVDGWEKEADGLPIPTRWIQHPFYGFTNSWEGSDLNVMPPLQRQKGVVIIALLGGSVGIGVTPQFEQAVHRYFADHVPGVEPIVLELALDGMKQPQQLMIVANMLLLGGEFDIIVNLDGHNEIEEPHGNVRDGTFPFFPYWWSRLVETTADQMTLVGHIKVLREEQNALLSAGRTSSLRWSAVFGLIVRFRLESTESLIRLLHHELAETETSYSLERHGPKGDYQNEEGIRQAAARVWYRGSVLLANLAKMAGAKYYHFLQPNQYVPDSKPFSDEELTTAYVPGRWRADNYRKTYPLLVRLGGKLKSQNVNFFDLTQIFSDNHETIGRTVLRIETDFWPRGIRKFLFFNNL